MSMAIYLFHVNSWKYFEFSDGSIIGRNSGDLTYPEDGNLSGKHVRFSISEVQGETQVYVEDLNSKNGSLVDRIQIPRDRLFRFPMMSLLEVGSQRFILTESTELKVQTVNDIVDNNYGHAAPRIDGKQFIEKQRQEAAEKINSLEDSSKRATDEMRALACEISRLREQIAEFANAREDETYKAEREKVEVARKFEIQKQQEFIRIDEDRERAIARTESLIDPIEDEIRGLELKINELRKKAEELHREAEQKKKRMDKFSKNAKV